MDDNNDNLISKLNLFPNENDGNLKEDNNRYYSKDSLDNENILIRESQMSSLTNNNRCEKIFDRDIQSENNDITNKIDMLLLSYDKSKNNTKKSHQFINEFKYLSNIIDSNNREITNCNKDEIQKPNHFQQIIHENPSLQELYCSTSRGSLYQKEYSSVIDKLNQVTQQLDDLKLKLNNSKKIEKTNIFTKTLTRDKYINDCETNFILQKTNNNIKIENRNQNNTLNFYSDLFLKKTKNFNKDSYLKILQENLRGKVNNYVHNYNSKEINLIESESSYKERLLNDLKESTKKNKNICLDIKLSTLNHLKFN